MYIYIYTIHMAHTWSCFFQGPLCLCPSDFLTNEEHVEGGDVVMQGRTAAVAAPEVLLRHVMDARQDFLHMVEEWWLQCGLFQMP